MADQIIVGPRTTSIISDTLSPYGELGGAPSRPDVQPTRKDLNEAALYRKMGWDGSQLRTATDTNQFPAARKVTRAGGILDLMSGIITSRTIAAGQAYDLRWYEDVVDAWIAKQRDTIAQIEALIANVK